MPTPCPHCSRRDALFASGAGFAALAFEAMLPAEMPSIDPIHPMKPRPTHFAPKAKSVIFLYMVGGPGHMDTFDYKPTLQKLHGKKTPESFTKALSPKFA